MDIATGLQLKSGKFSDVDDAYAIHRVLLGSLEGRLTVPAIIVQFGNAQNVTAMYEKLQTLIKKMHLPKDPLLVEGPSTTYNQTGGLVAPHLFDLIKNSSNMFDIASSGPVTSIALLMDNPAVAAKINNIYLEMGQYEYGPWANTCGFLVCNKSVGDFNFKTDIGAVESLIQKFPNKLHFVPYEAINDLTLDRLDLYQKCVYGSEAERWIASNSWGWFDQWTRIYTCQSHMHEWASVALLVASGLDDGACAFMRVTTQVEKCLHPATNIKMFYRLVLKKASSTDTKYSLMCPKYDDRSCKCNE